MSPWRCVAQGNFTTIPLANIRVASKNSFMKRWPPAASIRTDLIRWKDQSLFLSQSLIGWDVGLKSTENGLIEVWFAQLLLGHIEPLSAVLSGLTALQIMEKAILKVRLKQPIYLGLCPKPRFGGNSRSWRLGHTPIANQQKNGPHSPLRTGQTNQNL